MSRPPLVFAGSGLRVFGVAFLQKIDGGLAAILDGTVDDLRIAFSASALAATPLVGDDAQPFQGLAQVLAR